MAIETRFLRGTIVFNDWEVTEYIGNGSGGKTAVFHVIRQHEGWQEAAALKVINILEEIGKKDTLAKEYRQEYEAECKELCRQAQEELRLMSCLRGYPNIVEYYDFEFVEYQEENVFGVDLLIRMEHLENLREEQKKKGIYSESEIIRIGKDICNGLQFCHQAGIIHRDIKPANIFVTAWGVYKLGDFGIAKMVDAGQKASTKMGTRAYAAPEQFVSYQEKYDERVDIYSLGLTLYELANGNKLPFAESGYVRESEIQLRIMGKEFPVPVNISPGLAKVIEKACAYKVEDRYGFMKEFQEALCNVESGQTEKDVEPVLAKRQNPKKRGIALALVVVILIILLLMAWIVPTYFSKNTGNAEEVLRESQEFAEEEIFQESTEVEEQEESIVKEEIISGKADSATEKAAVSEETDEYSELQESIKIPAEGQYHEAFGKAAHVSVLEEHVAVINEAGDLYMWGKNDYGQVGCGNLEEQTEPVYIMSDVKEVYLSEHHTAAITENSDLYLWGKNSNFEIGNDDWSEYELTPQLILSDVKEASLGETHSGALCNNGNLYGWGNPNGNGIGEDRWSPTRIATGVKTFYMDNFEGGAVTESGVLYMWGLNWNGQVGNGPEEEQLAPVKIMEDVKDLYIGEMTSAAIKNNGDLYVWGRNRFGQVGDGSYSEYVYEPAFVLGKVKDVVLWDTFSAAITESNELYVWGNNTDGQLGTDDKSMFSEPYKVAENVKAVCLGDHMSAMLKENGDLYLAGDNTNHQIAESDLWKIKRFVKVAENITSVGTNGYRVHAVGEDGSFYSWGDQFE